MSRLFLRTGSALSLRRAVSSISVPAALRASTAKRTSARIPRSAAISTHWGGWLSFVALPIALAAQPTSDALDAATAPEVVHLDQLTVSETRAAAGIVSLETAGESLARVAGAVSITNSATAERGRVGTSADILAFQPGIFAAPPAGSGDGIKLSIRGSAIARSAGNFFRSGTLFSFDGLPVTGAGGTPYELFETYGLNYTEVLLGGNAFDYGALQLGGAINYVTKTGYDAAPFEARVEFGSFGYRKLQASAAQVVGKADYFVSVASLRVDGFQENSLGKALGFAGNVGYRVTPNINTRFFLRHRTTENANPGAISFDELESDPSLANPNNVIGSAYRTQPGSTWIAHRTTVQLTPDSSLELGLVYHDAPIDISPLPSRGAVGAPAAIAERSIWNFRDVTAQFKYTRQDSLFGRDSHTSFGGSIDREFDADVYVYANNLNVTTGPRAFGNLLKIANYDDSEDSSLRLTNELALTEKLFLHTGAALVYLRRAGEVTYFRPDLPPLAPAPGAKGREIDRKGLYFAPRLGLRYDVGSDITVFANVTRSIEGANSWQLNRGSSGNYQYHDPIRDQKAFAYEIGTRARFGAHTGSLSLFRSDVEDELLTIPLEPGNPAAGSFTFNGSDTYKQGVEFGLDSVLWSDAGVLAPPDKETKTKVVLGHSLSLNDFGYEGDPTFGRNELPGVPRTYYQARLSVDHASGFYGSLTLAYASSYFVDFANHLEAPSYTLLNASVGYAHPSQRWQVFLDARNLTDEHYASSANPTFDAGATDAARRSNRLFQAGDGLGVSGGVTLRF